MKRVSKSCLIAEEQNARYQHAQSLLVKGQVEKELSNATADDQIRIAQSRIDEIERGVLDAVQLEKAENAAQGPKEH